VTNAELSELLRLFVAIEVPEEWQRELTRVQRAQDRVSPGYFRWVQPQQMHLTLLFLGNQPAAAVAPITEVLTSVAAGSVSFELALGRVGSFGPARAPRVLWVEVVESAGCLSRLRAAAERQLYASGVAFDDRPLRPHITLGRARPSQAGAYRAAGTSVRAEPLLVRRLVLFQSRLSPSGPEYTALATPQLGVASSFV
jgi:RNA 2',3'-cyclic 3'-phosphodiesterase